MLQSGPAGLSPPANPVKVGKTSNRDTRSYIDRPRADPTRPTDEEGYADSSFIDTCLFR